MSRTQLYADPYNLFVHDVILESCRRNASKTALVDTSCGRRFTYAEYGETVESLARGLIGTGVAPGEVVAVFLANSWEFTAAYHAITLAGAIPTLLNPSYREREVRYQLENSGAVILISDACNLEDIDLGGLPSLRRVYTTRHELLGTESFAKLLQRGITSASRSGFAESVPVFRRGVGGFTLFQRNNRLAQGRHAFAPQSGREYLPASWTQRGALQERRAHPLLSSALPHLRLERDPQPRAGSRRHPRTDAAM